VPPRPTDGARPGDPAFSKTSETELHRGWVFSVVRAEFTGPDGERFERDIVRHPGAVAIVPVTAAHGVLLVRQFRPAVGRWLYEIPAGTCDVDHEAPEATAHRELAEEVGRSAGTLTLLTRMLNTPGFCDEETAVYLGTDLAVVDDDRQGVEERYLTVEEVPLDRFDALVDDGTIVDAATILGVGLARRCLDAAPAR
jgi:ADP-ribose pyrophosphatase